MTETLTSRASKAKTTAAAIREEAERGVDWEPEDYLDVWDATADLMIALASVDEATVRLCGPISKGLGRLHEYVEREGGPHDLRRKMRKATEEALATWLENNPPAPVPGPRPAGPVLDWQLPELPADCAPGVEPGRITDDQSRARIRYGVERGWVVRRTAAFANRSSSTVQRMKKQKAKR